MKRLLSLLLSLVMVLLCSCSQGGADDSESADSQTENSQEQGDAASDATDISGYPWSLSENAQYIDGELKLSPSATASCYDSISNTYILECDITASSDNTSGIMINRPDKYISYLLSINGKNDKICFYEKSVSGASETIFSQKTDIEEGAYYHVKLVSFNASVRIYINKQGETPSEYPLIDLPINKLRSKALSFVSGKGNMTVKNISISKNDIVLAGTTYINPIASGADPYILQYEGKYYLYSTNAVNEGYKVSVSTDLGTWTDMGLALKNADVYGNPTSSAGFWAPEVYYYNGLFYMIYTVGEHLGIATSESPLGPFKSPKQSYINNDKREIDGHLFFDDDGKVYIYFVRCASSVGEGTGNEIYGAEFDMETFTYKNERCLVYPEKNTWEWIGTHGYVAEGPAVLKHEGRYYMTYSANGYTCQNYAIGLAISDSPLGNYAKYDGNPILEKDSYLNVYGPGHHSFVYSPDGTELFMVYHKHQSSTTVSPRVVCIDRCYYEYDEKLGYDVLLVHGPTSTNQPLPSGSTAQ